MKIFKNALCLRTRPDTWSGDPNHCKRLAKHPGEHRIVYTDGVMAVWNSGDREARLLPRKKARKSK